MADLVTDGTVVRLKLEEFLPYRLARLASVIDQAFSAICARYDLSMSEWALLMALGEARRLTAKALGARCHMHKTKVSRHIARLLERNLISRSTNPVDQRQAFLCLTPLGQELYGKCAPIAADFSRQLEDAVDASDRKIFDRCLTKIVAQTWHLRSDPFEVEDRLGGD